MVREEEEMVRGGVSIEQVLCGTIYYPLPLL